MNRKTFSGSIFCFMLLFMYNSANGQDRIITVHNDTIECRILSITQTRINYEQTGGSYTVGKFIDLSEVSEYHRGVTQQNADRPEAFQLPDSSGADVPASRHWQAGLRFGGTYLVASSKDAENSLVASGMPRADAKLFYRRLKSGVHADMQTKQSATGRHCEERSDEAIRKYTTFRIASSLRSSQ